MRIVAGTAGGLPLSVPKGVDLRPTMDRVRAAIFSSLAERVPGSRVLDLFAGTGALGIEALSRGRGARDVGGERRARGRRRSGRISSGRGLAAEVIELDIFSYLDRLAPAGGFDLIFADPPYAKKPGERDFTPELLASESLRRALAADGVFILEHLPGATLPLGDFWECIRQRRYGATEVAMLRRRSGEGSAGLQPAGCSIPAAPSALTSAPERWRRVNAECRFAAISPSSPGRADPPRNTLSRIHM